VLRLAADENFNGDVVRGLQRRKPDVDIVRIQDAELSARMIEDPLLLVECRLEGEWEGQVRYFPLG